MSAQRSPILSPWKWLAVGLMLITALCLRLWGIDFGLPNIYHTDEWFEVKRALKLGAGVFDTHRVFKGGYFYLLFLEFGAYFGYLSLAGIVNGTREFLEHILRDPTGLWLIGRSTTALIGTINVLLVFLIGRRVASDTVGFVAAVLMAVHAVHVAESHYITLDVPMTTLVTACYLLLLGRGVAGNGRYAALGLLAAMAVMTKLPAVVIVFPVLLFHVVQVRAGDSAFRWTAVLTDRRLHVFAGTFLAVYVLGNPGIVLHFADKVQWVMDFFVAGAGQGGPYDTGKDAERGWYYLATLYPPSYFLAALLTLIGMLAGLMRYRTPSILLLAFILPYFLFLLLSGSAEHIYPRYVLPMTPMLWIFAGIGFEAVLSALPARRLIRIGMLGLLVATVLPLAADAVSFSRRLTLPDTRTLAQAWIESHIPAGSTIYIEGELLRPENMTVQLALAPDAIRGRIAALEDGQGQDGRAKQGFYDAMAAALSDRVAYNLLFTQDTDRLARALDQGVGDYIVLRSRTLQHFGDPVNQARYPEIYRLLREAGSSSYELWKTFSPGERTVGPWIYVFRRVPPEGRGR